MSIQILLGTSVGKVPFDVELRLAKQHKTTFYGSTIKSQSQIRKMFRTIALRKLYHACDMNGWNREKWPEIYALWVAEAAKVGAKVFAYPCPLFDEINQKPFPERWNVAGEAVKGFLPNGKYSKVMPFISGIVPVPEGAIRFGLPAKWILSLELNIWAIAKAVAWDHNMSIRQILATQIGPVANNAIFAAYLTKETGWADCTWFDAVAKKYGVAGAVVRPPDFRNACLIPKYVEKEIGCEIFQYYEASHLIDNATGAPLNDLKRLWDANETR